LICSAPRRDRGVGGERRAVQLAALVLVLGAATLCCGCGSGGESAAALRLQREDLIVVARALVEVSGPLDAEVAAAKTAWPSIANGLPRRHAESTRALIATAAARAAAIRLVAPLGESEAVSLTGPAAQIAGLLRSYVLLSSRGWKLIGAALDQIEHGTPAAGGFARSNAALYIESVYDGHFTLAQIGKKLRAGYGKLGGADAFGAALSERTVAALAARYSEANDRLHPHVSARLGS
jgi:hypothetical protein